MLLDLSTIRLRCFAMNTAADSTLRSSGRSEERLLNDLVNLDIAATNVTEKKGASHDRLAISRPRALSNEAGERAESNDHYPSIDHLARSSALQPIVGRQAPFRLINQKPLGGEPRVSQAENRSYRMADSVRSLRRRHLYIASRDGVIDAEENAIDQALIQLGDDLEQKADDERAALALIRVGRTKHTRGIVVDLFPSIGPEAA